MGDELEDRSLEGALRERVPEGDEVGDAEEGHDDEERLGSTKVCRTRVTNITWRS